MPITRRAQTLFCLLLALIAAHARAEVRGGGASVRVAAESVAKGERLTLGDVADVRAGDATMTEKLRAVPLGYAPAIGAVRELTRERIALAIAAAGFAEGTVRIEVPPVALVRRAAQIVPAELVREAIERAALAELRAAGADARLIRFDLPPVIEVPAGAVEARASLGGSRNLFELFAVSIELWVDGRLARRIGATAQVEAEAPVLVAARDLAAGERVREGDFISEARPLKRASSVYVRDSARLRGAGLRRAVARGETLTTDLLTAEIVVRAGDAVRIVGESGGLRVAVAGEARASGRVGDRVQVKNTGSGALLQAVVVDEGLVRVRF